MAWMIAVIFCGDAGILEAQTTRVASDDFNRANGPIGTNWARLGASEAFFNVTNHTVGADAENELCEACWASNGFSNAQYAQVLVTSPGPFTGVILQADTNHDEFYLGCVFGPNDYRIYHRVAKMYWEETVGSAETWQANDVLKLAVSDSPVPRGNHVPEWQTRAVVVDFGSSGCKDWWHPRNLYVFASRRSLESG